MRRRLFALGFIAMCAQSDLCGAQGLDTSAVRDAAIADLAEHFQRAERRDLLPGPGVPEISLFASPQTFPSEADASPRLCSMDVLRLTYYAPPVVAGPPSHVEPSRALSDIDIERVFLLPEGSGQCSAQDPSALWFRVPEHQRWDRATTLRVATLALGLIDALNANDAGFESLDMRAFAQNATTSDLNALRAERASRIGRLSWAQCEADQSSFCRHAEVVFGEMGPLTTLTMIIRSSRPSGDQMWIESASVRASFSAIP